MRKHAFAIALIAVVANLFTNHASAIPDFNRMSVFFNYDRSSFGPTPSFSTIPDQAEAPRSGNVVLPACDQSTQLDCIRQLEMVNSDGNIKKFILVGYIPFKYTGDCWSSATAKPKTGCGLYLPSESPKVVNSNAELNIPFGSKSSIWKIQTAKSGPESYFMLDLNMYGWLDGTKSKAVRNGVPLSNGKPGMNWSAFVLNLFPITIDSGIPGAPRIEGAPGFQNLDDGVCLRNTDNSSYCIHKRILDGDLRVKLTVSTSFTSTVFSPINWVSSRTSNAIFQNKPDGDKPDSRLITFEGNFSTVYDAGFVLEKTEDNFKAYCASITPNPCLNEAIAANIRSQFFGGGSEGQFGDSPNSLTRWNSLSNSFTPVQSNYSSAWNFHTVELGLEISDKLKNCTNEAQASKITNVVSGLTYSNATIFLPLPSSWNETSKSLEFKVASLHANSKGEVVEGYYGLAIEKTVAACLWGPNTTDAKAEISVFNDDGSQQIVTSTYNIQDGYLIFHIAGFHYSSDTIKIKLVPKSLQSTNSLTKTNAATSKITSINCRRNTLKKVITGVNPKCPVSFKKVTLPK